MNPFNGPVRIELIRINTTSDGSRYWYLNGELHRDDGPAIMLPDGTQFWFLNDQLHRTDGPAVVLPNGERYWYLNGIEIHPPEQNQ
jgi:hypothetical protein